MPREELLNLARAQPWLVAVLALIALIVLGVLFWAAGRGLRKTGPPADRLTVLAALVATGVAASGMWAFFDEKLPQLPTVLRVVFFGFLELAVLTSAVRARQNIREHGTAGVDGAAVWVLTSLSAVLSALAAGSFAVDVLRLATPFVAAWLWERGLAGERRKHASRPREHERIYWRFTRRRLLIRLGLADPADRQVSEIAAQHRVTALARAAHQAALVADSRWPGRRAWAARRLRSAMMAAIEHAHLATDPDRQHDLLAQLGALAHAGQLVTTSVPAPWAAALTALTQPSTRTAEAEQASAVLQSWAALWRGPGVLDPDPKVLFAVPQPEVTPLSAPDLSEPRPGAVTGPGDPAEAPAWGHRAPTDPALTPSSRVTSSREPDRTDPGAQQVTPPGSAADPDGVVTDLTAVTHDSERIRLAIDALGLDTTPAQITAWLAARGVRVTASNAKTVLRREKRAATADTARPA
ncbi:hypothetical protein ACFFMN_12090 [Planobispora siamensis]|uniref:Uncharacterized protein n=1 Tax=Planobispora siamensis TaxID=936338 RepID=A0A8J3SHR1_9ACTN|nr:hypothetical protein [Planobispora siamensis]GIH89908.1 hypothetical protein Psi01_05380 [Planobispora siamensis]